MSQEEGIQGWRFKGEERAERLYEHEYFVYWEQVKAASDAQARQVSGNAPTAWLPVPIEGVPAAVDGQVLRVEEVSHTSH